MFIKGGFSVGVLNAIKFVVVNGVLRRTGYQPLSLTHPDSTTGMEFHGSGVGEVNGTKRVVKPK